MVDQEYLGEESRFDCFTFAAPNGPHLRPGYDGICLVVTLNVLQLQVVGLKVLDILIRSVFSCNTLHGEQSLELTRWEACKWQGTFTASSC